MKHKDVTIVIQGPVTNSTIISLSSYLEIANVVLAFDCDDENPDFLKQFECDDLKIKTYKSSEIEIYFNNNLICYKPYSSNFIRQSYSSRLGVLNTKTKFCIKTRSDEHYENIEYFINKVKENENVIFTNNVYYRKFDFMPFHPSDHLIGSTTENMENGYNKLWHMIENKTINLNNNSSLDFKCVCPEQYLCLAFMHALQERYAIEINENNFKKYFNKVDVNKLGNYKISCNHRGQFFYNNFDHFIDPQTDEV